MLAHEFAVAGLVGMWASPGLVQAIVGRLGLST